MNKVIFYSVNHNVLYNALCGLIEKIHEKRETAIILTMTEDQVIEIDNVLWTYSSKSFIPHGSIFDSNMSDHPILISNKMLDMSFDNVIFINDFKPIIINNACTIIFHNESDIMKAFVKSLVGNNNVQCIFWKQTSNNKWEKTIEI